MDVQQEKPSPGDIAAYILGGGASRRMGSSKIALPNGDRTWATTLAERIRESVSEVFVVLKESQRDEVQDLPCIFDARSERAVVHGIRAALEAPGPTWRLVLACDMPGVDARWLRVLWQTARRSDALGACVRHPGFASLEPFPSLWHRDVAARVRPEWGLKAQDWLRHAELAVYALPAGADDALANLNTPAEWQRWERAMRPGSQP